MDLTIWELGEIEHQYGACLTAQIGSVFPKLQALAGLAALRGANEKLIKEIIRFVVAYLAWRNPAATAHG